MRHTGDVTSWTKCLSIPHYVSFVDHLRQVMQPQTNVEEDCAVELLVDNVIRQDLVV